jgi:hypothetical protein
MDKVDKLVQIIHNIREEGEGSIANVVGTDGLTGSSTPYGRMDGYDKVMGLVRRKKIIGLGKGSRNRWKKPQ